MPKLIFEAINCLEALDNTKNYPVYLFLFVLFATEFDSYVATPKEI